MINTCYVGDVRDGLRAFAAAGHRAQTCVTSPPYWGLRDYGTAEWDGGDPVCDHMRAPGGTGGDPKYGANKGCAGGAPTPMGQECNRCGARRVDRQIGLEPTPAEYVATMVDVFRHVRDALADDGTLWLNLGDSYATGAGKVGACPGGGAQGEAWGERGAMTSPNRMPIAGLKPKDLVGIPWRVAFALQEDGWYLRSDVIWHKPNPMPESVTDRPTKAHEYLFLLAKSERYFYDADAIAEPAAYECIAQGQMGAVGVSGRNDAPAIAVSHSRRANEGTTRNRRTVWTVATEPYSEAHFATFPTALIEPCILAGTSAHGHCPTCGKGWERVVERTTMEIDRSERTHDRGQTRSSGTMTRPPSSKTLGWQPTCPCGGVPVPGVVLDPFLGSGTTAKVAQSLGRRWFGCELNPQYAAMQTQRAAQLGMAFA